jgi:LAO/AO transport system kinase
MCDCFLLLMLAGAGDELQGIKKGIMEMADIIAITKADGANQKPAQLARAEFQHALHLVRSEESGWAPKVITCSAMENTGITETWAEIQAFLEHQKKSGLFHLNREQQQLKWFHEQFHTALRKQVTQQHSFGKKWNEAVQHVQENQWTVFRAVDYVINPDV